MINFVNCLYAFSIFLKLLLLSFYIHYLGLLPARYFLVREWYFITIIKLLKFNKNNVYKQIIFALKLITNCQNSIRKKGKIVN